MIQEKVFSGTVGYRRLSVQADSKIIIRKSISRGNKSGVNLRICYCSNHCFFSRLLHIWVKGQKQESKKSPLLRHPLMQIRSIIGWGVQSL